MRNQEKSKNLLLSSLAQFFLCRMISLWKKTVASHLRPFFLGGGGRTDFSPKLLYKISGVELISRRNEIIISRVELVSWRNVVQISDVPKVGHNWFLKCKLNRHTNIFYTFIRTVICDVMCPIWDTIYILCFSMLSFITSKYVCLHIIYLCYCFGEDELQLYKHILYFYLNCSSNMWYYVSKLRYYILCSSMFSFITS